MHKYLRAIGYSKIESQRQLQEIINDIIHTAKSRAYTKNKKGFVFAEYSKEISENIGIMVRGQFEEDNTFIYSHYFPYIKGSLISSVEDISVERFAEKEAYVGICDDIKVGVYLMFYLQNTVDYRRVKKTNMFPVEGATLTLAALSCKGTIMMPIVKNEIEKNKSDKASKFRNILIEAARKGDEDAIETLTLDDMDTYTTISRKIRKADVFTLVDTSFMPNGVECDQYSVLGEIIDTILVENKVTKEELYRMTVLCNEIKFDICINKEDLYGEPLIGRRFKGIVWMQGKINYPFS